VVTISWLLKSGQWCAARPTVSNGGGSFPDTLMSGFWSRASNREGGVRMQRIAPGSISQMGSRVEGLLPLYLEETGPRHEGAPSTRVHQRLVCAGG